jgi:hypothetical protein
MANDVLKELSVTMQAETTSSSVRMVPVSQITRRHIPEDSNMKGVDNCIVINLTTLYRISALCDAEWKLMLVDESSYRYGEVKFQVLWAINNADSTTDNILCNTRNIVNCEEIRKSKTAVVA